MGRLGLKDPKVFCGKSGGMSAVSKLSRLVIIFDRTKNIPMPPMDKCDFIVDAPPSSGGGK
jgi:hypothetical protein